MDLFNSIKHFFGLSRDPNDQQFTDRRNRSWDDNARRNSFGNFQSPEDHDGMGFNVFTNPLEMHRYFEQQMNEFMKQFQMEDHSFGSFGLPEFPLPESPQQGEPSSGSLRDRFLKSGYEKAVSAADKGSKVDTDVDGKFHIGDLDTVLKGKESDSGTQIIPHFSKPNVQFFGQSMQYKTIKNADGSIETHKTVRDNSGNEETTITRKHGDQEHTIIIRRDKDGREETTENLVNMDANDLKGLWKSKELPQLVPGNNKNSGWFPFDKFF